MSGNGAIGGTDDVPRVSAEPESAWGLPSGARDWVVTRRVAIGGAIATAGGLALTVAGALPGFRVSPAGAVPGSEYLNCAGYDNFEGYDDKTTQKACVGAPYGSYYCGNDGWYKLGYHGGVFYQPVAACGNGMTKKNAWRWTFNGSPYRCADGVV